MLKFQRAMLFIVIWTNGAMFTTYNNAGETMLLLVNFILVVFWIFAYVGMFLRVDSQNG